MLTKLTLSIKCYWSLSHDILYVSVYPIILTTRSTEDCKWFITMFHGKIRITSFEPFKLFIKSVLCLLCMTIRTLTRILHDDLYPSIPIKIIPPIRIMESPIGLSININCKSSITFLSSLHRKPFSNHCYLNPSTLNKKRRSWIQKIFLSCRLVYHTDLS